MSLKHFFGDVTPLSKILAAVVFITLPFVGFWVGMQYGDVRGSGGEIGGFVQSTEIIPTTKNMKLTLRDGETAIFEGLSITIASGGHKILQAPEGGRGGDLSFAEIELKAEGVATEIVRVFTPDVVEGITAKEIQFGKYHILVEDVGWNGDPVELSVEKIEG